MINPIETFKLYINERKKAGIPKTLRSLSVTINNELPRTIICHSLGCYLFLNYLHEYTLPEYVKEVIFIQGDISTNMLVHSKAFQNILAGAKIKFTNIYCPWDATLWWSVVINGYIPIGLKSINVKQINDTFIPVSPIGAHTNVIRKNKQLLHLLT